MSIGGRYSPFNLIAFNKRLRHALLTDVALNTDHDDVYYTKDEVNDIVEGNTFDFFLNNTNSDISSPTQYFVMDPTETGEAESTFSDTITNDAFLIDSWATSTSEPTFSALVKGIYAFHIHAETTTGANVGSVRLYFELYRRLADSPFTETLLITSEQSNILVGPETEYDIHGTLATDVMLDLTDRLVLKVYANIETSRPTDPLVTLTVEGTTAAHFEVVTTITAFDDRYVQVAGDTMTGNLKMGTNDITGVGNLGIGTDSPDQDLEVRGVSPIIRIRATGGIGDAAAYVEFGRTTGGNWVRTGYVGDAISGNEDIYLVAEDSNLKLGDSSSNAVLTLSGGNVTATNDIKAQTFSIGSGTINETELTFLDGATAGTASPSKALIVDSGKSISGLATIGTTRINIDTLSIDQVGSDMVFDNGSGGMQFTNEDDISITSAAENIFLTLGDDAGVKKVIIRDDNEATVATIDSDGGFVGTTFNTGTLSGNNSGDQSAGDFSHNSLADLNAGTDFEHLTQTQKDTLHAQGTDTTLGTMTASINMGGFDIEGTDLDISAGTGTYSSSGPLRAGAITSTGAVEGSSLVINQAGGDDEITMDIADNVLSITDTGSSATSFFWPKFNHFLATKNTVFYKNGFNAETLALSSFNPTISQRVVRTVGSGFAFGMFDLFMQNDVTTVGLGMIGIAGAVNLGATPTSTYIYLGSAVGTAFNNATLKIDAEDRIGIGLPSNNRPVCTLDVQQKDSAAATPVCQLEQLDIDDTFINFVGTSAADGTRSISSDVTEDSTKFGAIRIEINGVTKWIRIYNNES